MALGFGGCHLDGPEAGSMVRGPYPSLDASAAGKPTEGLAPSNQHTAAGYAQHGCSTLHAQQLAGVTLEVQGYEPIRSRSPTPQFLYIRLTC